MKSARNLTGLRPIADTVGSTKSMHTKRMNPLFIKEEQRSMYLNVCEHAYASEMLVEVMVMIAVLRPVAASPGTVRKKSMFKWSPASVKLVLLQRLVVFDAAAISIGAKLPSVRFSTSQVHVSLRVTLNWNDGLVPPKKLAAVVPLILKFTNTLPSF